MSNPLVEIVALFQRHDRITYMSNEKNKQKQKQISEDNPCAHCGGIIRLGPFDPLWGDKHFIESGEACCTYLDGKRWSL